MEQTEAFRALASVDRQLVLHELLQSRDAVPVADLSERVAVQRHRTESVTDEKINRAHIRLAHTHLPFLQDLNVIEWDGDCVGLADDEAVDRLFEAAEELDCWPPDDLVDELAA